MLENPNQNKGIVSGSDTGEPEIKKEGIESRSNAREPKKTKGLNSGAMSENPKQNKEIESGCNVGEPKTK